MTGVMMVLFFCIHRGHTDKDRTLQLTRTLFSG